MISFNDVQDTYNKHNRKNKYKYKDENLSNFSLQIPSITRMPFNTTSFCTNSSVLISQNTILVTTAYRFNCCLTDSKLLLMFLIRFATLNRYVYV